MSITLGVLRQLAVRQLAYLEVRDVLRQPVDRDRPSRARRPRASLASPRCARRARGRSPRSASRHAIAVSASVLPSLPSAGDRVDANAAALVTRRAWLGTPRPTCRRACTPAITPFIASVLRHVESRAISSSSACPISSASAAMTGSVTSGFVPSMRLHDLLAREDAQADRAARPLRPPRAATFVSLSRSSVTSSVAG